MSLPIELSHSCIRTLHSRIALQHQAKNLRLDPYAYVMPRSALSMTDDKYFRISCDFVDCPDSFLCHPLKSSTLGSAYKAFC